MVLLLMVPSKFSKYKIPLYLLAEHGILYLVPVILKGFVLSQFRGLPVKIDAQEHWID